MKKLLMFSAAFVLTLTASAAAAAPSGKLTLSSSNIIGIQQVKQNKNEVVVPVTFAGIGQNGGATTLAETLYLDNLSMAATAMVMLNSSSGYYSQWIWMPGFMTDLFWTARRDDDVKVESFEQTLARGVGLRVQNSNSSTPVYTLGEYSSAKYSVTLNYSTTTLLTNPSTTEEMDIEAIFSKGGISDYIYVTDNNIETTYQYGSTTDSNGRHWYRKTVVYAANDDGTVSSTNKLDYDLPKIKPGESFRYRRGTRGDLTVSW